MKWAVFVDRDGTINEEVEYLNVPEDLRLIPGAAEAIRLLNEARVLVIVVTNQAGIGRGYFPEARLIRIHQELAKRLATHGARLDAIYYCPHRPDEGCACRKPNPGMLVQAAEKYAINLKHSFMVGDKRSDLEAGHRAGCRTVLTLTGYGLQTREILGNTHLTPDYVARYLLEAVKWILMQEAH